MKMFLNKKGISCCIKEVPVARVEGTEKEKDYLSTGLGVIELGAIRDQAGKARRPGLRGMR